MGAFDAPPSATAGPAAAFLGTANAPEVSVAVDLRNPELHPRQLVYDTARDGLWFWTSTQDRGVTFENWLYFYDLAQRQLRSWPLYSEDWSSQLLAGLAVAPDGTIWIGWNRHLIAFHPSDGSSNRYELSAQPRYPLPTAALGDLPADLGLADLAVARDGTVWIARYAALSLTAFSPTTQSFTEYPLPTSAGDPAKLAIGPDGHIFFTTDLSADHPGYAFERVGEYDPQSGSTQIYQRPAHALAVAPNGDLYTAAEGQGLGLGRVSASERANARAQRRAPAFTQNIAPFAIDGEAIAIDQQGRVWLSVGGKPDMAVLDPATGHVRQYQYAAPSLAANPLLRPSRPGLRLPTPAPDAVLLSHMAAMVADSQGHLWYIRVGSDRIEEVAA